MNYEDLVPISREEVLEPLQEGGGRRGWGGTAPARISRPGPGMGGAGVLRGFA